MSKKETTKDRLLAAACVAFAKKGFRDATVAEICEAAGANIAAVNYHFGDKERLYDAAWRHAFAITATTYPAAGGAPADASADELLFAFANALLQRIFCDDSAGLFPKILYREMATPTRALKAMVKEGLLPQTLHVEGITKKVLGDGLDEQTLKLCMHSIIAQCAFFNFSRPLREPLIGNKLMTEQEIARIARHIATFSMGGLKEIQK